LHIANQNTRSSETIKCERAAIVAKARGREELLQLRQKIIAEILDICGTDRDDYDTYHPVSPALARYLGIDPSAVSPDGMLVASYRYSAVTSEITLYVGCFAPEESDDTPTNYESFAAEFEARWLEGSPLVARHVFGRVKLKSVGRRGVL
jgi:hypothetical protein